MVMTLEEDVKPPGRVADRLVDPGDFKERFGFDPVVDRQMEAAVAVLKGVRLFASARRAKLVRAPEEVGACLQAAK